MRAPDNIKSNPILDERLLINHILPPKIRIITAIAVIVMIDQFGQLSHSINVEKKMSPLYDKKTLKNSQKKHVPKRPLLAVYMIVISHGRRKDNSPSAPILL